jgi:hypothetical protein
MRDHPKMAGKQKEAFKAWDTRREKEGRLWDVLYHCQGIENPSFTAHRLTGTHITDTHTASAQRSHRLEKVKCQVRRSDDIHIPIITAGDIVCPRHKADENEDGIEDWEERTLSLFEWAGMAVLGAQRCVSATVSVGS